MQPAIDNRESALQFLNLVIEGKIDEAYRRFVNMDGRRP